MTITKIVKVVGYKTYDGKLFNDESKAREHVYEKLRDVLVQAWVEKHSSDYVTSDILVGQLIEYKDSLLSALDPKDMIEVVDGN